MAYRNALNYSIGEEDPRVEQSLIPAERATLLAVAGSGARIVPLLTRRPAKIVCADVAVAQLALAALRIALVRRSCHEDFLRFLGYRPGMSPAERQAHFDSLALPDDLEPHARRLLESIRWQAPLYAGRYETMLIRLSRINALFTGAAGRGIFDCGTLSAQRDYYARTFPRQRWESVVALLGNATVMNGLLYRGDCPASHTGATVAVYRALFERLFTRQPARRSCFLQMLFFGRLEYEEGFPLECDADVFTLAQQAAARCEIDYRQADVFACLQPNERVDFCSLSDVPSFLDEATAANALQSLRPHLAPGAVVVARGHLRYVAPDADGFADIAGDYRDLIEDERTGLWRFGIFQLKGADRCPSP